MANPDQAPAHDGHTQVIGPVTLGTPPTVPDLSADLAAGTRPLGLAASAFEKPRRFALHRSEDPDGATGVGLVAWGTLYPDGWVSACWQTLHVARSWYGSIEDFIALHGHGGHVEWIDV